MKYILTRRCTWFDNSPQKVSDFAVLHGLHPTFKIATGADVSRGHAEMGAEGFGKRL